MKAYARKKTLLAIKVAQDPCLFVLQQINMAIHL